MDVLTLWLIVGFLTESVTEILKALFSDKLKDKATFFTSMVVGILLAFAFGLNPFGLTGYGAYASTVVAGILASRGANYLNGVLKEIGVIKSMK